MRLSTTDVEFTSQSTTLRGWLIEPTATAETPKPTVVMAHGFAGHKEWVRPFADILAEAGFATLVYDHACFGDSDGQPRQEVDPWRQVEGYRDAITFAESLPAVDSSRIGVWGTSFAGGHAMVVGAVDHRVRAVVSQVPLTHGMPTLQQLIPAPMWPIVDEAIAADRRARLTGSAALTIPSSSADPAEMVAMPGTDVYEWLMANGPQIPTWRNEVTVSSIDKVRTYTPETFADRLGTTPIHFIVADRDVLTPVDLALAAHARVVGPKALTVLPGGHFSVYEENLGTAARTAAEFFTEHLR